MTKQVKVVEITGVQKVKKTSGRELEESGMNVLQLPRIKIGVLPERQCAGATIVKT